MRDERLFPFFADISTLAGIGPKTLPLFERLAGGESVWDLLLHLPERWLDRRVKDNFDSLEVGEVATVRGEVHAYHKPYSARSPHRIQLFDGTGFLTLSFFRAEGRWLQGQFPIGKERIVSGRIDEFRGERQMSHPDYIIDPSKGVLPPSVEPIYGLTAGLTNKRVHTAMQKAIETFPDDLPEWHRQDMIDKYKWPSFLQSLKELHTPQVFDLERMEVCRQRLAYDEALARASTIALAKRARKSRKAPHIPPQIEAQENLIGKLPFRPTGAQLKARQTIANDMEKQTPMRRMLQGDVGSGKTLVAVLAAVHAAASGFQTAFMAPTSVLASQQFETFDQLLSPLGYSVALLTGRQSAKAREETKMAVLSGDIDVLIGTQALFQSAVQFKELGLVVVDEQHRFGVQDRMRLLSKGRSPHVLVMSATPIPRTLGQLVHGDLDVSVLDEKPIGRKPITTRAVPDSRIDKIFDAVGRAIGRGEKVFWICPKVDIEDDESSAVQRRATLQDRLGTPVQLVHGRMSTDDKDQSLNDFKSGAANVLVATTVIEVGIDVPSSTIMVIERAERFGLSQLHQLRGRVGRGQADSYCILLYRPPLGEIAKERLSVLRETNDGFEIAEADYKLRGPGDILGVRQSGMIDYRALDLVKHGDLLDIAAKDTTMLLDKDPRLESERGASFRLLRELLAPSVRLDSDS